MNTYIALRLIILSLMVGKKTPFLWNKIIASICFIFITDTQRRVEFIDYLEDIKIPGINKELIFKQLKFVKDDFEDFKEKCIIVEEDQIIERFFKMFLTEDNQGFLYIGSLLGYKYFLVVLFRIGLINNYELVGLKDFCDKYDIAKISEVQVSIVNLEKFLKVYIRKLQSLNSFYEADFHPLDIAYVIKVN